jgi:hypothetical protein
MNRQTFLLGTMAFCVALTGCDTTEKDWSVAKNANTLSAYQTFLQEHPGNIHEENAKGRILALNDDLAWNNAHAADTIAAYRNYLNSWSGGIHAGEATFQIKALQRAADWKVVSADPSVPQLQAFLLKYPQGAEADLARAQLTAYGYRVQIAESSSEQGAQRERERMQARFGKVLDDIVVVPPIGSETKYRITSQPMSKSAAGSTCAALEHAHHTCKLIQAS